MGLTHSATASGAALPICADFIYECVHRISTYYTSYKALFVVVAAPAGGERSYTTVAFLLAFKNLFESPFRFMDEYDVFMDSVNRRIATQMLLDFARDESHMQLVLLTPQVMRTHRGLRASSMCCMR
jgi:hypothetical protein